MRTLNGKRYLNVREAAERVDMRPVTVYRMLKRGIFRGFVMPGTRGWYIEADSVQEYLDNLTGVQRPATDSEKEE